MAMSCGHGNRKSVLQRRGLELLVKSLKLLIKLDETAKKENEEALSYIYYRAGKLFQRNSEEKKRVAGCTRGLII